MKLTEVSQIFGTNKAVHKSNLCSFKETERNLCLCPHYAIIIVLKNCILFGKLKDITVPVLIAIRSFRFTVRCKLVHHQCSPYLKRTKIKCTPVRMFLYTGSSFFKYCYLLLILTSLELLFIAWSGFQLSVVKAKQK